MSAEVVRTITIRPQCDGLLNPVDVKTGRRLLKYELARSRQSGRFWHCANPGAVRTG